MSYTDSHNHLRAQSVLRVLAAEADKREAMDERDEVAITVDVWLLRQARELLAWYEAQAEGEEE